MSQKTNNQRISFALSKSLLDYPDFLEVQLKSFKDFFQLDTTAENRKNEGLYKVFQETFPITDTRNNFVLEFIDYFIDPPRYTIEECLDRGLTYSVPLKAKLKLYCTDQEHEDFDTEIQDVYLGTIPYMIRTYSRIPVAPFPWRVFRTERSCQWNKTVFSPHHPFQGVVD